MRKVKSHRIMRQISVAVIAIVPATNHAISHQLKQKKSHAKPNKNGFTEQISEDRLTVASAKNMQFPKN